MEDQRERGKLICEELYSLHSLHADWYIDPCGELLLMVDNKWLMRCIEKDGDSCWIPVRATQRSLRLRELGKRKIEYTPLFD